jgi:hypothetical protein
MALPFLFISFGNHQIQGKPVIADRCSSQKGNQYSAVKERRPDRCGFVL